MKERLKHGKIVSPRDILRPSRGVEVADSDSLGCPDAQQHREMGQDKAVPPGHAKRPIMSGLRVMGENILAVP